MEDGGSPVEIQVRGEGRRCRRYHILPLCQVALVQEIRVRLGPSFHISYTIPCLSEQFEPWASVIPAIIADIDAVNVMAYDYYWDVSISSS